MQTRWGKEYAPKFNLKRDNLRSPLAAHQIKKLCEWISDQTNPDEIPHCESCKEKINKKLYFPVYGWHIVFRFEDDTVVFVMFYNAPEGKSA